MGKTLVIAEKPSVGRDLSRVLPGPFAKNEGFLEGSQHVITWAVGHLVQLAEPDQYEDKFKKWRMADLPIVPDRFKLVIRDERSKKQMNAIKRLLSRDDVDSVVNACDAGREGELIFAYLYEKSGSKKPVRRLWLNSMTKAAIKEAFGELRPGADLASLEAAARSRSEADWIVGMNATRAATIRLRSAFDGAVSLGRVQTPTLAILAKREQEIRAFVPEPYWVVDATFDPTAEPAGRVYEGRFHAPAAGRATRSQDLEQRSPSQDGERVSRGPRVASAEEADAIVAACRDQLGAITKLEKSERKERPPLLYDLTSLQSDASSRYGFTARRTLAAAQRLYEEHTALTYPRTNSRYLPGDMIQEIRPIARVVGERSEYAQASRYVTGLDVLPLARVVNDAKVTDHHAIIPTNAERHPVDKMSDDDRRIYDLVARRFLAAFHPEAVIENTRVETTVGAGGVGPGGASGADESGVSAGGAGESGAGAAGESVAQHVFRTRGKRILVPGWRGVYGEEADTDGRRDDDEGREQQLPRLAHGERAAVLEIGSERKETQPPRRYSDGSLLRAMEAAGKLVDDEELREAMKESGIGTPATRAAIIERLLAVGYLERDGRALVVTEKGMNVVRLLGEHALTSPSLTGDWERRLARIETGEDSREAFMGDIVRFTEDTVGELDRNLKDVRIERAKLGPCPVCGREIVENRKGYSCWSRDDPGCGFVIWKSKAGKSLPVSVARELIRTGRTEKPVSGFKSRAGRNFRARLALQQNEDGKWRAEFDEPWAKEGAKPPEAEAEQQAGASEERQRAGAAERRPAAA
jgi:DNA topoisomerase-3